MTEKLLQYLWKYRFYDARDLKTLEGQRLQILQPGLHNHNQGPDFLHARLYINDTLWVGHVEIHVNSSEWIHHGHTGDPHYANVILHVVWKQDAEILLPFPTLELDGRVSGWLLQQYRQFMESQSFIPCQSQITEVDPIVIRQMIDRAAAERMLNHSCRYQTWLAEMSQNRERTFWRALCRNFGFPVNQELFEAVFQSIPFSFLLRNRKDVNTMEAVFLGQAGLIHKYPDPQLASTLHKTYLFRKAQLGLPDVSIQPVYFRLRPASFPELRISRYVSLFAKGIPWKQKDWSPEFWIKYLQYPDSGHSDAMGYVEMTGRKHEKIVGAHLAQSIYINTLIPAWAAESRESNPGSGLSPFLEKLAECVPERNHLTQSFSALGIPVDHALDSQGLVEMKKKYCDARRCLECSIGQSVLKQSVAVGYAQ